MNFDAFYSFIGMLTVFGAVFFIFLLLFSLLLGMVVVKKRKIIFPKLLLFFVDHFYYQMQKLAELFGLNKKIVDEIGIEIRNKLHEKKFKETEANERILVLPQCLRSLKCPARLDPMQGIMCRKCGLCVISGIKEEAEKLGYRVFSVPGGRFVERIVKQVKPKAAIGVACAKDLNRAMRDLEKGNFIVQGVPLLVDGCVTTQVNTEMLFKKMRLGIGDFKTLSQEHANEERKTGCEDSVEIKV